MNAISKKLLSMFLVVAMALSMVPFGGLSIFAVETKAATDMNASLDFATSTTQVCPKCGTEETWQPLTKITANTALAAGHYYVPEGGVTNSAQYNVNTKAVRCIHLNGQTLSSSARVFNLSYNSTLNIFGSGTVKSTNKATSGVLYYLGSCTVNLYGGTHTAPNVDSTNGGYPIRSTDSEYANLNIYDGATISTAKWRTIYMTTGTITMNGGTINGGNVYSKTGGTVMMEGGTFNMKGGTIQNANVITGNGGNLYISGGTFNMTGGTIQGGSAASGGNVYVAGGTFNMTGGTIQNGTASANGGNIATASKTLTIGGKVLNGTAATGGGNISGSTGSVLTVSGTVAGGKVTGTAGGNWGGNIYAWQATVNVEEGAKIYGGSSSGKPGAANIGVLGETAGTTAILNLNGGTVVGDIHTSAPAGEFAGTTVKITGAPNVVKSLEVDGVTYSATTQGLFLDGVTADISGMTGGTVYLTGTNGQAMTAAYENASTLSGCFYAYDSASQQVYLTENVFYLNEKQAIGEDSEFAPWDNDGLAYCPACKAVKTWTATSGSGSLSTLQDGTHIYLATNHDATGRDQSLYVAASATACFNLNGNTLYLDGRIGINTTDATLNIMDTSADGTGVVTSTGTRTENNAYNYTLNVQQAGSTINLYGGTYRNGNASTAVVRCTVKTAEVNIYEGAVIDGNNTCRGILLSNGTVNIEGGIVKNGKSTGNGGNIVVEAGAVNMNGGSIFGGSAVHGGNVNLGSGTKFTMTGDAKVYDGTASGQGGNFRIYAGDLIMSGTASVYNGTAGASPNVWLIDSDMIMSGNSTVLAAKDSTVGGSAVNVKEDSNGSKLILSENASVKAIEGTASKAINLGYNETYPNQLLIANNWAGEAYLYCTKDGSTSYSAGETMSDTLVGYCGELNTKTYAVTKSGSFEGNLYNHGTSTGILGSEGNLIVGVHSVGDDWFTDYNDALTAYYASGSFAKGEILTVGGNVSLTLNGDIYIDSKGYTVTIDGEGKLYALDRANDDYVGFGTWTINSSGVTVVNDVTNPVNGNRYIVIRDAAGSANYHAHRVEIKLTHITLRTSEAGLYYKSEYKCDTRLASRVSAWGVAVSTDVMPRGDFLEDYTNRIGFTCQETGFTPNAEHTLKGTSGSVFGIFKGTEDGRDATTNATYGKMKIYANAYFMVEQDANEYQGDDLVVVGVTDTNKEVSYSLYDALVALDGMWTNLTEDQQTRVKDFYGEWKDLGMSAWANDFENIDA